MVHSRLKFTGPLEGRKKISPNGKMATIKKILKNRYIKLVSVLTTLHKYIIRDRDAWKTGGPRGGNF